MLEKLYDLINGLDLGSLSSEQRKALKDNYNTYIRFEYCKDEDDNIIFKMDTESFKSFEYYLGMEYEREDILFKVQVEEDVFISYNEGNSRVEGIVDRLELFKEDDEE